MRTATIVLCSKCGKIKTINRDLYQISWCKLSILEKSAIDTIKKSTTLKSIFGDCEIEYEICEDCKNST